MVVLKTPWTKWEHWFVNRFPSNPTQTDYTRFERKWGTLPENQFDKSMKQFDEKMRGVLKSRYTKDMEDITWQA